MLFLQVLLSSSVALSEWKFPHEVMHIHTSLSPLFWQTRSTCHLNLYLKAFEETEELKMNYSALLSLARLTLDGGVIKGTGQGREEVTSGPVLRESRYFP